MYPYVLLRIENNIPNLFFVKDQNTETKITEIDVNLEEVILRGAKELGMEYADIDSVLALVNHADEHYMDENPDINPDSVEFELDSVMDQVLEQAKLIESNYAGIDMTDEVKAAIEENHKHDILASIINILYKAIIAKSLIALHDLELDKLHFTGDKNYARLTEKMGKEVDALGLELFID